MRRRGFTLIEMLVALALFAMAGLLYSQLIHPVLARAFRLLNEDSSQARVAAALAQIRSDVASTVAPGVQLRPQAAGWVLTVVPLEPPAVGEAARVYSKQAIVYCYRQSDRALHRETRADLEWPDHSARLTGAEPTPFTSTELDALGAHIATSTASNLDGAAWTSLQDTWKVDFKPPSGKPGSFFLDVSRLL